MIPNEAIDAYLLQMGRDFTTPQEGVWIIHDEYEHVENIVVANAGPIITFRVKIMEIPDTEQATLYEEILRLNASDMVAGAYGLEDDAVVIVDTLQSENLDFNEFEASIDGLSLAISMHLPELSRYLPERKDQAPVSDALTEFGAKLDEQTA